jgi:hypothetical protein
MKLSKPRKLLFIAIFAWLAGISFSCKKNDNKHSAPISEDAIVVNTGGIAADGCGWQIKTVSADSTYSPQNLSTQYEVNNLKVHIVYHKLIARFYCSQVAGDPGPGITEIQIDSISTR